MQLEGIEMADWKKEFDNGVRTSHGRVRQLARGHKIEANSGQASTPKLREKLKKIGVAVQKESIRGHKTRKK